MEMNDFTTPKNDIVASLTLLQRFLGDWNLGGSTVKVND